MIAVISALVTMFAWGTWLAPSQNVSFRSQQIKTLYVAAANLVLALVVALFSRSAFTAADSLLPAFAGGLVWSVSGLCAFTATNRIGIAKAFGIWAPVNIIVGIFWGAVLFGEFVHLNAQGLVVFALSLVTIIAGVLMIIFARGDEARLRSRRGQVVGFLSALGAGVLWGSYFIPMKLAGTSVWVAALPMAVGIFCGSLILALLTRLPLPLEKGAQYVRVSITGLLWGIGNYAMLILVSQIGAGKGFTISQLSVVINALIGVFLLRDPAPKTRAAWLTLAGCALATLGGIVLGNLK
jgi:glucose uptake protein